MSIFLGSQVQPSEKVSLHQANVGVIVCLYPLGFVCSLHTDQILKAASADLRGLVLLSSQPLIGPHCHEWASMCEKKTDIPRNETSYAAISVQENVKQKLPSARFH